MEGKGKKMEASIKVGFSPERNELSMHSEGLAENDQEGSEKFFSFNQSFTNIEHNNKLIQEKTNSLHRVRALEDEIKSCKSRSALWEKVKSEIIALNQYLQLNALSLGCSDSAIMREFFEAVRKILTDNAEKEKDEKWKMAELSKQNKDLFEKLVVSNKMRYELEQELVNYKHDISKLSDINTSLREKSRAQSTERSSKIQEFHQETILTINQKQLELTNLEQYNYDLRHQVSQQEEQLSSLRKELNQKADELLRQTTETDKISSELQTLTGELERERQKTVELKKSNSRCKEEQRETENQVNQIKEYLKNIVEENISIRTELSRRAEQISELRMVIQEAKHANEQFIQEQAQIVKKEKEKEKQKIAELLQQEIAIKKNLKANLRFGVNSPQRTRSKKKVPSRNSIELVPSSEELLI